MAVAINIDFTLIVCGRCGTKDRVAGRPCSDCDDHGREDEMNARVVRRRQGLRAVSALMHRTEPEEAEVLPFYLTHSTWLTSTGEALEETLDGLAEFSAEPLVPHHQLVLANAIARLRRIESELSALSPRRPFVSNLETLQLAASCLVRMADLYLAALHADLPSEAQTLGKRAQAEIDAASQLLKDAAFNEKIADALGTADPKDFTNAAFGALAALYPDRNLFEIDAIRQAQLRRDLGREVASGQGAAYEISLALAKSTFNPKRFETVIAEASRLFTSPSRLREIANEPGALPTLLRARNAIVESSMAFAATLTTAFTDEARLARTINLYRELFEYSGMPLFAWYLRVGGAKSAPLAKLFKEDSTALLAAINRNPDLASIFVGADKNIRTAASHGFGYELVGNDVVFNTRSFEGTMTVEVVIDLLLALVESLLAAFWVLDNELTVAGIEGHMSLDKTAGTPILTVAEEVLRLLGASVTSSGLTPAGWEFEVSDVAESSPHFYLEGLAGNPLQGINEITITCQHLANGELRIPRKASTQFTEARNSSPMALVEANLNLLSASTINGRSVVSAEHLRRSACVAALALLSNDDLQAIRVLRRCLALAHNLQAADVKEFAEASISEWRSPEPDRHNRLTETMMSWNELPAPALPTVRITTMTELQGPEHLLARTLNSP